MVEKEDLNMGFGRPPLKAEGQVAYPDIYNNVCDMSDEWYLRQLQGYKDWAGDDVYEVSCSRPELLKRLK